MNSNQKALLIGGSAIAGFLLLKPKASSVVGGGGSYGFTVTKPAVGSNDYSIPAPIIYNITEGNTTFSEAPLPTSAPISDSKKSSNSNIATGKYYVGGGVYTNPEASKPENIFNTSVPKYIDEIGQGVSYTNSTKKTTNTSEAPKTSSKPSFFSKVFKIIPKFSIRGLIK